MIEEARKQDRISELGVQADEEEETSVDFAQLLSTLYCGRITLLVVTLGSFVLATAVAFVIPAQFTSRASFIPPSNNSNSTVGMLSQLPGLGAGSVFGVAKSSGDLYVGILQSRSVESEIVKRFDLKNVYKVNKESQAETLLAFHSNFQAGVKDSIVTISVSDASPGRARDLANAYIDALRETNGRLALSESSQRRIFFGEQLAKEKDALEDAEVNLKKTEEQSGLIAPTGQMAIEIQAIAQTRAQIASRQVQLSSLRQAATPQNPDLIRLQSEIIDLQGQLTRLQTGTGRRETGAIPTSKVPELELDNVRKTREVKYHEALFEMLSRQLEAARLDESHEAPLLQVLDAASYPDFKSSPKRKQIMLGGLILGCLVGSVWVLLREHIHGISRRLATGNFGAR